jgi:hypothetical protein
MYMSVAGEKFIEFRFIFSHFCLIAKIFTYENIGINKMENGTVSKAARFVWRCVCVFVDAVEIATSELIASRKILNATHVCV